MNAALLKEHPRAALAVLLAIHVLAHVDRNLLLGFSTQVTAELNLSGAQYGFLNGAVWVLSFGFMAVLMGMLADRFARTRVMAVGILIWSVCTAASGTAHSFGAMAAARFFVASGEAALVPAAVSLIVDLFRAERRGTAVGIFFVGIPIGLGTSLLLAGTLGGIVGWRETYGALGIIGVVVAVPLLFVPDRRDPLAVPERGISFLAQFRAMTGALRGLPGTILILAGLVLVQLLFAEVAFTQLWLVRDHGLDALAVARQMGVLQLVFGFLGAFVGGTLSDGISRRIKGGHAGFMAILTLVGMPMVIAYHLAAPGSPVFVVGMCAAFFLPLSLYGPALALIQGSLPASLRSTVTGFTMLLINVFAIAIGNVSLGAASDWFASAFPGEGRAIVLVATDCLIFVAGWLFLWAARNTVVRGRPGLLHA